MPKISNEPLFELIKSLTKSEKRNFKLYAKRISLNEEAKFVRLFDIIDQLDEYNEDRILSKGSGIKAETSTMSSTRPLATRASW